MTTLEDIERTFERYQPIVDDWAAFCAALTRPLPTCVWTNTLRAQPAQLAAWFERLGLEMPALGWHPEAFKYTGDANIPFGTLFPMVTGMCHIQEEVSLMPTVILGKYPGQRVLDMCAAPGGKTAQLAVQLGNQGTVVANDRSYQRLRALRGITDRLGLVNITMTHWDATSLPGDIGLFDRVLADVPCSCEGTSRKNHSVTQGLDVHEYTALANIQRAILMRAIKLARPGGVIVYSTCTYAPEENECVLQDILDAASDRVELLPTRLDGVRCVPGLLEWRGRAFDSSMTNAMRLYPHHNDTGGFFVATLRRKD